MDTREFLKRYAYVYLFVSAFFLGAAALFLHSVETSGETEPFSAHPVIIIDAGHGAPDGGASSASGIREDELNLQITKRLEKLLVLMGYDVRMTRTGSDCIATEGETIREKKLSDLRNRVKMVNSYASAILVSIHQNHYSDRKYFGPQVFYTNGAEAMAAELQKNLNTVLAPGSKRAAKPSSGVYLMEHAEHPAVLVECGFLSNPTEARKLVSPEHQKKAAAVMAATLARYTDGQL